MTIPGKPIAACPGFSLLSGHLTVEKELYASIYGWIICLSLLSCCLVVLLFVVFACGLTINQTTRQPNNYTTKPLKCKFYSESSHAVATCKLIGDFWLLRGVFVVAGLEVSGIDGYFVIYLILCTESV